jgi:hypothetical protein
MSLGEARQGPRRSDVAVARGEARQRKDPGVVRIGNARKGPRLGKGRECPMRGN